MRTWPDSKSQKMFFPLGITCSATLKHYACKQANSTTMLALMAKCSNIFQSGPSPAPFTALGLVIIRYHNDAASSTGPALLIFILKILIVPVDGHSGHLAFENSFRGCQYPLGSTLSRAWLSSFVANKMFFTWVTKLERTGLPYIVQHTMQHIARYPAICKTLACRYI